MSKSIHATRKELKGKTKKEIDEMVNDQDSPLHDLVEKRELKSQSKKKRKQTKLNIGIRPSNYILKFCGKNCSNS